MTEDIDARVGADAGRVGSRGHELPRSHWTPRTRDGWISVLAYVAILLLAMPPFTHTVLDRPGVWIAGVPLFFAALFVVYVALIGVLVWALRRGL